MSRRKTDSNINRTLTILIIILSTLIVVAIILMLIKNKDTDIVGADDGSKTVSSNQATPGAISPAPSIAEGTQEDKDSIDDPECIVTEMAKPKATVKPEQEDPVITSVVTPSGEDVMVTPPEIDTSGYDLSKPMIALSFDDGPHSEVTERILKVLKENNVKATFFMLGVQIKKYPEIVKKVYDEGHEIASHTIDHKDLTKLSKAQIKEQVVGNNDLLKELVPIGNVLLRPPYGAFNDVVQENVDVPMMCWNIDTLDWSHKNKDKVIKAVMDDVKDGSVILMHDIYGTTADAVEYLVPKLIKEGYQIVTVSELFQLKKNELKPGRVYRYADNLTPTPTPSIAPTPSITVAD